MTTEQNNPARRHHILPRLLLKRFAENDQVWMMDRIRQNSCHPNMNNAVCQKDYYTVETTGEVGPDCIEQWLASIEGSVDPIIDRMLQTWAIPKDKDWYLLANFLALMYCRGPVLRTIVRTVSGQECRDLDDYIHSSEDIFRSEMAEFCKMQGIEINYEEAIQARKDMELRVNIPNTYYVRQMLSFVCFFASVFAEMTPNLERIDTLVSDARFVISDCPIVPISRSGKSPKGWNWCRNFDADLFSPVSSKTCLVLNYDKLRKVSNVSRSRVAFVNHIMSLNSERAIISEEQDFVWLRPDGTIVSSHQELLDFLKSSPQGSAARVDLDSLKQRTLKVLKQRGTDTHLS